MTPVMAVPMVTPTPMTAVPAPMTAVPMPVMTPAHLFGFELVDLCRRRHRRMGILIELRQPAALGKRLWRKWCGLRARAECGSGGKAQGKSEKVAAFHVHSPPFAPS